MDSLVASYGKRAMNLQIVLNKLYQKPFISISTISEALDISHQTAASLVKKMVDDKILTEVTGYQRNKIFGFYEYVKLFLD